jgi:UrcA family protein
MTTSVTARATGLRFKIALLMITAGLGTAMAAGAATIDSDVPSLAVKYDAQSLSTDTGVQQLYRRIRVAAEQVCPEETVRDLGANARVQACRSKAMALAIQHIGNTRLAALYASSSKSG